MDTQLPYFTVVFRPEAAKPLASNIPDPSYQAAPETIRKIATDFAEGKKAGVYDVFTHGQPTIFAVRFADVLRID